MESMAADSGTGNDGPRPTENNGKDAAEGRLGLGAACSGAQPQPASAAPADTNVVMAAAESQWRLDAAALELPTGAQPMDEDTAARGPPVLSTRPAGCGKMAVGLVCQVRACAHRLGSPQTLWVSNRIVVAHVVFKRRPIIRSVAVATTHCWTTCPTRRHVQHAHTFVQHCRTGSGRRCPLLLSCLLSCASVR